MRLERRREERLVDRAKRRSVASLTQKVLAARVAAGAASKAANATAKTKGTAKSE